jgi:phosphoenolpyruvate carboxylase
MSRGWPFFATLLDNAEPSPAKTDLYIAGRYASLVEDVGVRRRIFNAITDEYERSRRAADASPSAARHWDRRVPR